MKNFVLDNGITSTQIHDNVKHEVERIYLESWAKGVSIPFWDDNGNFYLANPDGSEDKVNFDRKKRRITVVKRVSPAGQGRYAYLLHK